MHGYSALTACCPGPHLLWHEDFAPYILKAGIDCGRCPEPLFRIGVGAHLHVGTESPGAQDLKMAIHIPGMQGGALGCSIHRQFLICPVFCQKYQLCSQSCCRDHSPRSVIINQKSLKKVLL
jgi:hypothetical protein